MAFHLGKFLAHLSPASLERHLGTQHPRLVSIIDWAKKPGEVRAALERVIRAAPDGEVVIVAFERVHLLADDAGDRAMIAAARRRRSPAGGLAGSSERL